MKELYCYIPYRNSLESQDAIGILTCCPHFVSLRLPFAADPQDGRTVMFSPQLLHTYTWFFFTIHYNDQEKPVWRNSDTSGKTGSFWYSCQRVFLSHTFSAMFVTARSFWKIMIFLAVCADDSNRYVIKFTDFMIQRFPWVVDYHSADYEILLKVHHCNNRRFPHITSIEKIITYECVSTSFRTGRLVRELQMVQLSVIRCSCIGILWVSLVGFAAITLCVASQRAFIVVVVVVIIIIVVVITLLTQSGNFWIHPRI
jgi:hypothetical protein